VKSFVDSSKELIFSAGLFVYFLLIRLIENLSPDLYEACLAGWPEKNQLYFGGDLHSVLGFFFNFFSIPSANCKVNDLLMTDLLTMR